MTKSITVWTKVIRSVYKGLYIVTSDKEKLAQMGAGKPSDSAVAGFHAAYIRGHKIEDCLRYGNAAGLRNVTVPDGLSWNKGFDDLTERIKNWGSDPLDINELGWRRENELWIGEKDKTNQTS